MTDGAVVDARFEALEAQMAATIAQLHKVEEERDEYRKLVLHLREECERLKRGLLGQKAERLPQNGAQLSLAMLTLAMAGPGGAPEAEALVEKHLVAAHTRQKPVRKPLPESLPRVTIEITPPEVERNPDAFERIGSETRETLERRPAASVVVKMVRGKYVLKGRDTTAPTTVLVGELPELPIERGLAGPGFLADTIVRRWWDHQPLNRLEGIYARDGLDIARSTVCTWHMQLAELARPLHEAMFADALGQPYVCVDATGVLVLANERCKVGHFWVLVAPERHVLFRYSEKHDGDAVDLLLPGFAGYLVADAHSVYDHLYTKGTVVEVACWAHARRYFWKSLGSDPERAHAAINFISALFQIERMLVGAPRKKKREVRQQQSKPLVNAFFAWCDTERPRVLDESPIADAIRYATNQRIALERFLDDGQLPLHNNISELNLRRQVVGRKNWLFCGSDDGAEANTIFVSLLASARMHEIEPLGYIRDLLCLLPRWPKHQVLDLAPVNWNTTIDRSDVRAQLDANVFRQVALGHRT